MVAGCPKCSARYRVDAERIGPDGAKLRCTKCSAVFLVRASQAKVEAPDPAVPAPPVVVSTPAATQTEAPSESATGSEPMPEYDSARLVVIADPDEARGKATAEAVTRWGLDVHLVQDGVEAMMAIQRMLPSAVVLDAALPKMFGFQVCEVVKRNESLQETLVVLVGAIHHQDRYRRNPAELYGADVYIEQPDLPDGLKPILREHGLPLEGGSIHSDAAPAVNPTPVVESNPRPQVVEEVPETPAPALSVPAAPRPAPNLERVETIAPPAVATPTVEPMKAPAAVAEPAAAPTEEDPLKTEERERALRLSRIAVSEMLLYQPEKFEKATRDGNLEQMLDLEIQEARALLRQRIGEEVRAEADFIMDELNRVAAERSEQG